MISLATMVWIRDFILIPVSKGLIIRTPEEELKWHAQQNLEAACFWVLLALSAIALIFYLKPLRRPE